MGVSALGLGLDERVATVVANPLAVSAEGWRKGLDYGPCFPDFTSRASAATKSPPWKRSVPVSSCTPIARPMCLPARREMVGLPGRWPKRPSATSLFSFKSGPCFLAIVISGAIDSSSTTGATATHALELPLFSRPSRRHRLVLTGRPDRRASPPSGPFGCRASAFTVSRREPLRECSPPCRGAPVARAGRTSRRLTQGERP